MHWLGRAVPLVLFVSACGGTVDTVEGGNGGNAGNGGSAGSAGSAGNADNGGGAGGVSAREPTEHRADRTACGARPATLPPGAVGVDAGQQPPAWRSCLTSADCTSGPNGRCLGGRGGPYCSYDACFADADCGQALVCRCGAPDGTGNRCLASGCQVDADCPHSWCSPTFGTCGNYSGVIGYACHTPQDTCVNDTDCGNATGGPGSYCMYDAVVAHWVCSNSQCVG